MAAFFRRQIVRSALTSGAVMACGDVFCQVIQSNNVRNPKIDWKRTSRFAVVGLTLHGPFFFHGFKALDAKFGSAATLRTAVVKTAVGQVTLFPVYVSAFFAYMGALEGLDAEGCIRKVQQGFPNTIVAGSVFWPVANVLNFRFVPTTHRVLYVNIMGLLWNSYLSWSNSTTMPVLTGAGLPVKGS